MSEQDELMSSEPSQEDAKEQVLCIEKVVGGYGGALGLQKGDIIAGVNGVPFTATKQISMLCLILTKKPMNCLPKKLPCSRLIVLGCFSIFWHGCASYAALNRWMRLSELPDSFQDALSATSELSEYLIYYDNSKMQSLYYEPAL